VLGPLGVEVVAAHAFPSDGEVGPRGLAASVGQAKRLVSAVGADLGAVFDSAGERLFLIDERAREVPVELALLLYLRLIGSNGNSGGKVAFPVTVTSQVDRLVEGTPFEVVRTPASLQALTEAAAQEGVVFAGAVGGGYVFPDFLPGYDAVASLANLLELLAPVGRPLSDLLAELPRSTLVHHQLACPWGMKGLVMRLLNERFAGRDVDLTDGIKVFEERGWAQALPDPDEPLIHLYAEGETSEASEELADELRRIVEEIEQGETAPART
jgi:mannose-1-phosphate guanylyltransferase/phosphomannomutase